MVLSALGHLLAVEFAPALKAPDLPGVVGPVRAVEFRPVEVEIPPPPDPVPRPHVPRVERAEVRARAVEVDRPALDAGPSVGELPPPPPADDGWDAPSYIRPEVAPRPDRAELEYERLDEHYPEVLENAGVEGVVDLWVYVDRSGDVTRSRVVTSSGFARLDSAAVRVVGERRYLPALNRDRPVGVWVTQRVCFVQESREEVEEVDGCATLVEGG